MQLLNMGISILIDIITIIYFFEGVGVELKTKIGFLRFIRCVCTLLSVNNCVGIFYVLFMRINWVCSKHLHPPPNNVNWLLPNVDQCMCMWQIYYLCGRGQSSLVTIWFWASHFVSVNRSLHVPPTVNLAGHPRPQQTYTHSHLGFIFTHISDVIRLLGLYMMG